MDPTRRRLLHNAARLSGAGLTGAGLTGAGLSAAGLAAAGAAGCSLTRGAATHETAWTRATPGDAGIDPVAWAEAFDAAARVPNLRSLLAVHDGRLIGERYFGGAGASDLLPLNLATKSVVSLLVGQALAQGRIASLAEPLRRLLPAGAVAAPSPAAGLTLAQLLTGRSGQVYDWATDAAALAAAADPIAYALQRPLDPAMPPRWGYNDAAVGLLSPILEQAQGLDLSALAQRDLFGPLGIATHRWRRDRTGRPTAYGGLALRSRDLMKLAWLALDGGRWNGAPVVPAAWLADALLPHGPAGWRVAPVADVGYGYLWFTGRLGAQQIAWGWGYGGQYMVVVPALRLAVTTATVSPPPALLGDQTQAVMAIVARLVALAARA